MAGRGLLAIYDVEAQRLSNLFQGRLSGFLTSQYLHSTETDPGYYELSCARFTLNSLLTVGDAAGGLRQIDPRTGIA